MFGFFSNMLYPANKFLTAVLGLLKYDESTYDIDELTEQMNDKEECELLDATLNVEELNKKLKLKNFLLNKISIKKSIFVFKRNYMSGEKTILSFEGLTVDIFNKLDNNENEVSPEEEKEKSENSFLDTIINMVIQNLEINFKNIKIRFYDKENKNVEYTFFLKSFDFKEAQNVEAVIATEKIKYLFIHNKAFYIDGILLKEKYEEDDDIFFSEEEENNEKRNKFLQQKTNLFLIKNKIELDIFHDKDNNLLTIGSDNTSDFKIEGIFNTEQLVSIYHYFIPKKPDNNNVQLKKDDGEVGAGAADGKVVEEKKGMTLMGFKIEKINFDIKLSLLYFILVEPNEKEKLWVSCNENLFKDMNNEDVVEKVYEHFNYFQKKYYIFIIYDLLIKLSKKQISINDISLDLIDPKENNENHYTKRNVMNISKFNFNKESNEFSYDTIYIELSPIISHILKLIPKSPKKKAPKKSIIIKDENNNISNNQEANIINENKENKENNENDEQNNIINVEEKEENFKIKGQSLNVKIFIDKNAENDNNKNTSINDIFINNEQYDFIELTLSNLSNEENSITYDKFYIHYNEDNNKVIYPILKLIEHKNMPEKKDNKFICNKDILSIDLQFEIILFINPKILKNILTYCRNISESLGPKEPNVNDNNTNNNNDKKFACLLDSLKRNIEFKLKGIKIYLINDEESYLNIESILSNLPENIIERKNNNYICFNLIEISFKLNLLQTHKECNMYLKDFIIEDNISKSKYKIMLSNYDFKNKVNKFINFDLIIKKNQTKYEIEPSLKICSIAIYLDQIALYYIYSIFKLIKSNNEDENVPKNMIQNNEKNNLVKNDDAILVKNISIGDFFLVFNYNSNSEVKDEEFLSKTIIKYLFSLTNLKVIFKEYLNSTDTLGLFEAFKKIYEFYSSDILNQITGSFVSALPLINHITYSIDGLLDIYRKPVEYYQKNESALNGFVDGVTSCVVNVTTMFTYLGESFSGIFSGCIPRNDEDDMNMNTCRSIRHNINKKNKEIEDYYFK